MEPGQPPTAQGVPSFLQFPEFAFLLRQGRVYDGGVGGAGTIPSAGLRCGCHLVFLLPAYSHTQGLGPWHYPGLPPPWASRARWVGARFLPEPLSMSGGAIGMGRAGYRHQRNKVAQAELPAQLPLAPAWHPVFRDKFLISVAHPVCR